MQKLKVKVLKNYIRGQWSESQEKNTIDVVNPAKQEVLARVPYGVATAKDAEQAIAAAVSALQEWRNVPVLMRVQPLYKLKQLLEENMDELAKLITLECGKTYAEAKGEMQRGLENVEMACAAPSLMQSEFSEKHRQRHRRVYDPSTYWRLRLYCPFQFPGHDPILVFSVRDRLRQQLSPKALRKNTIDDDESI